MKIITTRLKFKTEKQLHIKDITSDAENFVEEGNIQNGVLVVFSLHTSATLTINEKESCFFKDFEDFVEKFAPSKDYYRHNDLNYYYLIQLTKNYILDNHYLIPILNY